MMTTPILGLAVLLAAATVLAASPQAQTYDRIQLKSNGQELDASSCSAPTALNAGSTYANGACQLWRLERLPVVIDQP